MALSKYFIATGEGDIHRFRLSDNCRELVDEIFSFSSRLGGSEKKTLTKTIAIPSSWNVVSNPQNLSLPALSSQPNWTLFDARNITEINTGKKIVCALLSSWQENQLLFLIVTTSSDHKKLLPLKYVKVYKQCLEVASVDGCKPRLIDGPGVMWAHNSFLYVATSSYGSACLNLKKSNLMGEDPKLLNVSYDEEEYKKQNCLSVLFYHHFQGMSLVVGTRVNNEEKKESFAVVSSLPVNSFKYVDNSGIIPEPYMSTIQHVKVLQCRYSKQDGDYKLCEKNNYCLDIRLLTFTYDGYLTEFHSGKLTRCLYVSTIKMGISQLTVIPTIEGSSSFPVIITNEQKACIITPQLTKVHSIMEGFSHAFVDDFMSVGSFQLLLVQLSPKSESKVLSNHWLLTDFDSCHFASEPQISQPEGNDCVVSRFGTDECPEAVEKALGNKIQLEILSMEEKLQLLKIRNDFIINCWQQLVCNQSEKKNHCPLSTGKKPGMMSFVEGSTRRAPPAKQTLVTCPLEIIRSWQKIYMNQWIVGVDFRYSKPKLLQKASLLIISSGDSENNISKSETIPHHSIIESSRNSTLCGQSFFWKNNTLSSYSPKDHFTVTCAIRLLPELTVYSTCKFHILLCLNTINEELQKLQTITYPCGTINFGVQQMIGATVNGTSSLEAESSVPFDELKDSECVLNAVQSRCKVHIRSKKSQLTFMEEHLKCFKELSWNSFLKCFLWCPNSGPFVDTRLAITKAQPHNCRLTIFAREITYIPALVHFLYSRLPEDVIILPEMSISLAKMSTWLQRLQSYLQNLSKEFCSIEDHKMSDEGQLTTGESEPLTADFLDQIRHEYETKKRKIIDRNVVDLGKCQTIITLLEKQKFHLDSLAVIFS